MVDGLGRGSYERFPVLWVPLVSPRSKVGSTPATLAPSSLLALSPPRRPVPVLT
jgi:hypothetical protein